MGLYDTFKDGKKEAQVKCFNNCLMYFSPGEEVPVEEYMMQDSCTICEWGGTSTKFSSLNIMGRKEYMGTFVIIEYGIFTEITEDESRIIYPVYDKYGTLLATNEKGILQ